MALKIDRKGSEVTVFPEGQLVETSDLYSFTLSGSENLTIDLEKVTTISSIGIKNWISWSDRLPKKNPIKMKSCPTIIVNQASMVVGFVPANTTIESWRAFFICESCSHEDEILLLRGTHYQYPADGGSPSVTIPKDATCSKCKTGKLEPDFLPEKIFKFLTMKHPSEQ